MIADSQVDTAREAVPPLSLAVPRELDPSRNVTVPEGTPDPPPDPPRIGATAVVSVTA